MKSGMIRIMDANLNRSREGLRVCEDLSRFVLSSAAISRDLKLLRHGIASIIKEMPVGQKLLLASRDCKGDVGRLSKLGTEMRRVGAAEVFTANIQRVKESLRVLEEIAKLIDVRSAVKFQRLRFRTYDVEKNADAKFRKVRGALRNTGRRVS